MHFAPASSLPRATVGYSAASFFALSPRLIDRSRRKSLHTLSLIAAHFRRIFGAFQLDTWKRRLRARPVGKRRWDAGANSDRRRRPVAGKVASFCRRESGVNFTYTVIDNRIGCLSIKCRVKLKEIEIYFLYRSDGGSRSGQGDLLLWTRHLPGQNSWSLEKLCKPEEYVVVCIGNIIKIFMAFFSHPQLAGKSAF